MEGSKEDPTRGKTEQTEKKESVEEKAKKQAFLRAEIMDKGLEVENFVAYLNGLKEDGANIDRWSMDELIKIVGEYKDSLSKDQPQQSINEKDKVSLQVDADDYEDDDEDDGLGEIEDMGVAEPEPIQKESLLKKEVPPISTKSLNCKDPRNPPKRAPNRLIVEVNSRVKTPANELIKEKNLKVHIDR